MRQGSSGHEPDDSRSLEIEHVRKLYPEPRMESEVDHREVVSVE
jgi:hypothetical protein